MENNNNNNNEMTALELMQAVWEKASEIKKELEKSYFSNDRIYFNKMLCKFPTAYFKGGIYETINNLAAMEAKSLDY